MGVRRMHGLEYDEVEEDNWDHDYDLDTTAMPAADYLQLTRKFIHSHPRLPMFHPPCTAMF